MGSIENERGREKLTEMYRSRKGPNAYYYTYYNYKYTESPRSTVTMLFFR